MRNASEMRYLTIIILLFISFLSFTTCDIINPSEKIPSYLHIDSFDLQGNYDSSGTLSHLITDVWVIVDNDVIGVYELPADIPVLKEGPHKITLKAGIKENGISNTRLPYPFYAPYLISDTLKANRMDTIKPIITYNTGGFVMPFNEDYESSDYSFTKSEVSAVIPELTSQKDMVFEGNKSLYGKIIKKYDLFQIESVKSYALPRGHAIFLELNYKSDIALKVGYYAVSTTQTYQHLVLTINPSKTWKKIYVNIGGEVDYEPKQYIFKFFLGAVKYTDSDTALIQFDNIKLFYLE
jgi:hypothetical protein